MCIMIMIVQEELFTQVNPNTSKSRLGYENLVSWSSRLTCSIMAKTARGGRLFYLG